MTESRNLRRRGRKVQIEHLNLKGGIEQARFQFDTKLADVLIGRSDLSYDEIQKEFGVSEKVIRRVIKQFNIGARRRGPKRTVWGRPSVSEVN